MIQMVCGGRTDGLGSQFYCRLNLIAWVYAHPKKYEYIYRPLQKPWFISGQEAEEFEELVGLKYCYPNISSIKNPREVKEIRRITELEVPPIATPKTQNKYFSTRVRNLMTREYAKHHKPKILLDESVKNMSIHLRRGASDSDNRRILERSDARMTKDDDFLEMIPHFKKSFPDHQINIFAAEGWHDFTYLRENLPDANFFIGNNIVETFHALVSSDVFVPDKSTLSFCAALFNKNIVMRTMIDASPFSVVVPLGRWKK